MKETQLNANDAHWLPCGASSKEFDCNICVSRACDYAKMADRCVMMNCTKPATEGFFMGERLWCKKHVPTFLRY